MKRSNFNPFSFSFLCINHDMMFEVMRVVGDEEARIELLARQYSSAENDTCYVQQAWEGVAKWIGNGILVYQYNPHASHLFTFNSIPHFYYEFSFPNVVIGIWNEVGHFTKYFYIRPQWK
jgi:hypothetical protein